MKTTCAKPSNMFEILGQKTPTGKKVIVHSLPPEGTKFNLMIHDCGQCTGCKIRRRMDLALRLEHEAQFHDNAWFVTATYDDEHLPYGQSLIADHMSAFIKALRQILKRKGIDAKIRFFAIGEYGEDSNRPHYHFIIFGPDFPDKQFLYEKSIKNIYSKELESLLGFSTGAKYYQSEILNKAWGKGLIQLTSVSEATMQYVAKYHVEKVNGELAEEHYTRLVEENNDFVLVEPETARMSRNPGIGRPWIEKYWPDVYPDGYITTKDGLKFAPPKYYDKWLEENKPEMYAELKLRRAENIDLEMEITKRREDIDKVRNAGLAINKQKRGQ